jgi:hypothetical protein
VKIKAIQLRIGASGDGAPIDFMNNIKIFRATAHRTRRCCSTIWIRE